jgi:hypothetical protein
MCKKKITIVSVAHAYVSKLLSRVCENHTLHVKSQSACGNRTLRVEINLMRLVITFERVVITLIRVKIALARRNYSCACGNHSCECHCPIRACQNHNACRNYTLRVEITLDMS